MNTNRIEFEKQNGLEHDSLVISIIRKKVPWAMDQLELVKDLLQEGRLAVWTARKTYDPVEGSFGNYAHIGIYRRILNYIRYNYPTVRVPGEYALSAESLPEGFDETPAPVSEESEEIPSEIISDMMQRLPTKYFEILADHLGLKGEKPMTFREIAETRGVTTSAVAQSYRKALKLLLPCAKKYRELGYF